MSKPIGLISADEILATGSGKFTTANEHYLKRGLWYWSGSPYNYDGYARVFYVNTTGSLNSNDVNITGVSVAPVINLTAEYAASLIGDGTIGNEYRAQMLKSLKSKREFSLSFLHASIPTI